MVAYHVDANAILVEPVKNRGATTLLNAWQKIFDRLHKAGSRPNAWILDNECSTQLKDAMHKNTVTYQLVPPHCHRANAAERAIQTFKAHFKSGLALLDPDFPIREWDRLLLQAEITLNLLRSAKVNPKISAHAFLFGTFGYDKNSLVLPSIKVLAHSKPDV